MAKILVVEGNDRARNFLRSEFSKNIPGVVVECARSWDEARELLRQGRGKNIIAAIVDVSRQSFEGARNIRSPGILGQFPLQNVAIIGEDRMHTAHGESRSSADYARFGDYFNREELLNQGLDPSREELDRLIEWVKGIIDKGANPPGENRLFP